MHTTLLEYERSIKIRAVEEREGADGGYEVSNPKLTNTDVPRPEFKNFSLPGWFLPLLVHYIFIRSAAPTTKTTLRHFFVSYYA